MENVGYLEIDDFTPDGNLKPYVGNGKPVVIMAQGNFCGYCKQASPAYAKFAKSNPNVMACSILIDGESSEKDTAKFCKKWDLNHKGVPAYFGFDKMGKFKKVHNGGRDDVAIIEFANSL